MEKQTKQTRRYRGPGKSLHPSNDLAPQGTFGNLIAKVTYDPKWPRRRSNQPREVLSPDEQREAFRRLEEYMIRYHARVACNPDKTIYFIQMKSDTDKRLWRQVQMFVDRIHLVIIQVNSFIDLPLDPGRMDEIQPPKDS